MQVTGALGAVRIKYSAKLAAQANLWVFLGGGVTSLLLPAY